MTPQNIADGILLLGPGFVLLKVFALTGGQHQRLQWEWAVWSVLLSVLVAAVTGWLVPIAAGQLATPHLSDWEPALRFLIAGAVGGVMGLLWIRVRQSRGPVLRRIYRTAIDSAWDLALDDATRMAPDKKTYGVEATIEVGGAEAYYYGTLAAFGYERAKAEPWIYLTYVQRWEGVDRGGYMPMARTEGLLLHRDQIKRLRIISPETDQVDSPEPNNEARQAHEV